MSAVKRGNDRVRTIFKTGQEGDVFERDEGASKRLEILEVGIVRDHGGSLATGNLAIGSMPKVWEMIWNIDASQSCSRERGKGFPFGFRVRKHPQVDRHHGSYGLDSRTLPVKYGHLGKHPER